MVASFDYKKEVPLLPSFDDEKLHDLRDIYPTSKLLGQMFFWELTDMVSTDDVAMNLVETGFVKGTELQRGVNVFGKMALGLFKAASARTVSLGTWKYLDAAIARGKESLGCVLMNWDIFPYAVYLFVSLVVADPGL